MGATPVRPPLTANAANLLVGSATVSTFAETEIG